MTPDERTQFARVLAERDAYRIAFRDAFVAYLKAGHGMTAVEAESEAVLVMAATDRRIADEVGPPVG